MWTLTSKEEAVNLLKDLKLLHHTPQSHTLSVRLRKEKDLQCCVSKSFRYTVCGHVFYIMYLKAADAAWYCKHDAEQSWGSINFSDSYITCAAGGSPLRTIAPFCCLTAKLHLWLILKPDEASCYIGNIPCPRNVWGMFYRWQQCS